MAHLIKRGSAEARAFGRRERDRDARRAASLDTADTPRKARARDNADFVTEALPYEGGRKPRFAPVTFSEEGGVRYLHFGTEWVQGAMRLRQPDKIELEYAQQMMAWLLFLDPPKTVAQLGLGTGALTKFSHRYLPKTQTVAVELNPAVVVAARSMFGLPYDDKRLHVVEADAWEYVNDAAHHGTVSALQIDLYDATARGPVLDSTAFYRACRASLAELGVVTVNLFGDHPSFRRNMKHLAEAFDNRVVALPEIHDGNRIAIAFSGPALSFDWTALARRARWIERTFKLPATSWVEGLKAVHPGVAFTI
ncbi:spermidine synthase [Pararobbsia silviterrae]|uniref:Spermidine synthase n=1 Tax=Pararobbsia silviterrae TaxID=1792498 RepID=A0A494YH09_9BURK|nr:spermidine synthase [Pararobbsia silviterrae]RKP59307.1 spermidine synthase [Pararobbsia silviterrae]